MPRTATPLRPVCKGVLFFLGACYKAGQMDGVELNMELSTWPAIFAASWAISISTGAGTVAAGTLLALFKRAA